MVPSGSARWARVDGVRAMRRRWRSVGCCVALCGGVPRGAAGAPRVRIGRWGMAGLHWVVAMASEFSGRFFERLFGSSAHLLAVANLDGYLVAVTPGWNKVLGHATEALLSRPYLDFVHPDDVARTRAEAGRLAGGGNASIGFQNRYRKADGTYCWLRWKADVDRDEGLIFCVVDDVTADVELERRTREANRLLRMAEEMSGTGHWWVDLATNQTGWSAEVARIYGIPAGAPVPPVEEGIKQYHPDDRGRVQAAVTEAIEQCAPYEFEARVRGRDGVERWVRSRGRPEMNTSGQVTRLFGVIRDISQDKYADDELRKLAAVANRTMNAVILADSAGRIEWVNAGFTRITGYTFEEVKGKTPGRLLQGPGTDPKTVAFMRERISAGKGFQTEILNYGKDGRPYWLSIEVQPLRNERGEVEKFMAVEADITAQKESYAALERARQAAEDALEAKSRFLANMSHEIRTPMHGVLGMTDLLLRTDLSERQMGYAETIATSGESLMRILNDILDYSKLEAGYLSLESEPFSPTDLIEEVRGLFRSSAEAKGVRLTGSNTLGEARVVGDATRVRQILSNLVGNAVKFTTEGEVSVSARERALTGAGLDIEFRVRDTGIGFEPELIERLFEPFTQADDTTTRRFGGTGLGLAICRQLAHAMGGALTARSEPGKGSEFVFSAVFPVAEGAIAAGRTAAAGGASEAITRGTRVLLADDSFVNRAVGTRMLELLGFEVDACSDGREAVQLVQSNEYRVAFLDIHMPEVDGVEAAREIRALPPSAGVGGLRLVAMTANVMPEERAHYLASGMDGHIAKPFDLEALRAFMLDHAAWWAVPSQTMRSPRIEQ